MSNSLGTYVRSHRARKAHRCDIRGCEIKPGKTYVVGVTLPGSSAYPIGGGDYEPVDWPFTVIKACPNCYHREYFGE